MNNYHTIEEYVFRQRVCYKIIESAELLFMHKYITCNKLKEIKNEQIRELERIKDEFKEVE